MTISAQAVKELREKTGAGMMDCKKALTENGGDMNKAAEWLRVKGLSGAGKKAGRVAAEGSVGSYIHMGGKIGVLCEVNCESDFVARGEDFKEFVKDISMQIAAANPEFVRREDVPAERVAKERALFEAEVKEQGKPAAVVDKIVNGKVDKWYADICLMEQPWVKEPKKTIEQVRAELVQKTGENVQVRRFARYVLGEGIEKKAENFAAEIAKMQEAVRGG
ncbi:MAG: translation elongation factor Ts [Deltaproteobacteria bacterium]|nr:translation elongation factor Ts [Deltaproteobacteria bacterium]